MNNEEARQLIQYYLRQLDGGYYPLRIRFSPTLEKLVDEATAQSIYDEEIALLERESGPLPRWDSEKHAPVPGTPKP
jgi:hypothetical protein